jgi:hypothetical protein
MDVIAFPNKKIVKSRLESSFSMCGYPGNGYEAVVPPVSNVRTSVWLAGDELTYTTNTRNTSRDTWIFLVLLSGSFSVDQMQLI